MELITNAAAYMHARGVAHRDLSHTNLIVSDAANRPLSTAGARSDDRHEAGGGGPLSASSAPGAAPAVAIPKMIDFGLSRIYTRHSREFAEWAVQQRKYAYTGDDLEVEEAIWKRVTVGIEAFGKTVRERGTQVPESITEYEYFPPAPTRRYKDDWAPWTVNGDGFLVALLVPLERLKEEQTWLDLGRDAALRDLGVGTGTTTGHLGQHIADAIAECGCRVPRWSAAAPPRGSFVFTRTALETHLSDRRRPGAVSASESRALKTLLALLMGSPKLVRDYQRVLEESMAGAAQAYEMMQKEVFGSDADDVDYLGQFPPRDPALLQLATDLDFERFDVWALVSNVRTAFWNVDNEDVWSMRTAWRAAPNSGLDIELRRARKLDQRNTSGGQKKENSGDSDPNSDPWFHAPKHAFPALELSSFRRKWELENTVLVVEREPKVTKECVVRVAARPAASSAAVVPSWSSTAGLGRGPTGEARAGWPGFSSTTFSEDSSLDDALGGANEIAMTESVFEVKEYAILEQSQIETWLWLLFSQAFRPRSRDRPTVRQVWNALEKIRAFVARFRERSFDIDLERLARITALNAYGLSDPEERRGFRGHAGSDFDFAPAKLQVGGRVVSDGSGDGSSAGSPRGPTGSANAGGGYSGRLEQRRCASASTADELRTVAMCVAPRLGKAAWLRSPNSSGWRCSKGRRRIRFSKVSASGSVRKFVRSSSVRSTG